MKAHMPKLLKNRRQWNIDVMIDVLLRQEFKQGKWNDEPKKRKGRGKAVATGIKSLPRGPKPSSPTVRRSVSPERDVSSSQKDDPEEDDGEKESSPPPKKQKAPVESPQIPVSIVGTEKNPSNDDLLVIFRLRDDSTIAMDEETWQKNEEFLRLVEDAKEKQQRICEEIHSEIERVIGISGHRKEKEQIEAVDTGRLRQFSARIREARDKSPFANVAFSSLLERIAAQIAKRAKHAAKK